MLASKKKTAESGKFFSTMSGEDNRAWALSLSTVQKICKVKPYTVEAAY